MMYKYSRWDGTQQIFPFDADEVMDALSEDLMNDNYNDLMSAMQRLYRWGFDNQMGERMQGLQEMLDKLRARRQQEMNRYDLDTVMQDIREKLDKIVQTERQGMQRRMEQTDSEQMKERLEGFMRDVPCPECDGTRLKPEILAVTMSAAARSGRPDGRRRRPRPPRGRARGRPGGHASRGGAAWVQFATA